MENSKEINDLQLDDWDAEVDRADIENESVVEAEDVAIDDVDAPEKADVGVKRKIAW